MAETAVRPDLDQTADVLGDFAAEIALDAVVFLDESSDRVDLILRDVVGLLHRVDLDRRKHVIGALRPNTMDIAQGEANVLLARDIHTHHSRHICFTSFLALALLVARVCADHAHHALAADDAAVLADATNGTTYFHLCLTLFRVVE